MTTWEIAKLIGYVGVTAYAVAALYVAFALLCRRVPRLRHWVGRPDRGRGW